MATTAGTPNPDPLGERTGVGFSGADREAAKAHGGGNFRSGAEVVVARKRKPSAKSLKAKAKPVVKPKTGKQTTAKAKPEKTVNRGRHEAHCKICAHPEREEIERDFVSWCSPIRIVADYGLADRASVYRHVRAFGLFAKRQRNVRAALERIIEKADEVDVNATAVVGAIQTYAKINSQGQLVERHEQVNLNELFERMTAQELETYAKDGVLPDWFTGVVGATPPDSQEVRNGA